MALEFDNIVEQYGLECLREHFKFIGPHDLTEIETIETKADGSLISTFLKDGTVRLKTKGSIASDQAHAATRLLYAQEYTTLLSWIREMVTVHDATVNMEYCAPTNRIVLGYDSASLFVLNVRDNKTGEYWQEDQLAEFFERYPGLDQFWVESFKVDHFGTTEDFIQYIKDATGIEGFVCTLRSGLQFKLKTPWYVSLHHSKDSINTPRRLFEAVLDEGSDDLKSMFFDDPSAIELIVDMEKFVEHHYNHLVSTVENFHKENGNLDRKSYAIKGQQELPRLFFKLAMEKYLGRAPDYKDWMKSKWREYNLKDEKVES